MKKVFNFKNLKTIQKNKEGTIGFLLLSLLIVIALYTLFFIPSDTRSEWNNPLYWIDYPKNAAPAWINFFLSFTNNQLPEHVVLDQNDTVLASYTESDFSILNRTFSYSYNFNYFPSGFSIPFTLKVGEISPSIEISVQRPDGNEFLLYSNSINTVSTRDFVDNTDLLINSDPTPAIASQRIFSTSQEIRQSLNGYSQLFNFSLTSLPAEKIIFSNLDSNTPLKGNYKFIFTIYSFDNHTELQNVELIINGQVFGVLGTDEFRRDIFFGILIGTPVALFIGLTVALSATIVGLLYGLAAGYKGNKTGSFMVTIIDVFLSVPTLVIFIILSIHFGNSLLFLIGLFILFGWPGLALLNRTFSIQIKNYPYVEASKLMGESDLRIILRHIVPQLLPFTLANFALAVPAAILAESALSFLGFGDPSFPTWGQMLQDAHFSSAEILGYWWWIIPPGLMISITSMAFIFIGRSLENRFKINKKF